MGKILPAIIFCLLIGIANSQDIGNIKAKQYKSYNDKFDNVLNQMSADYD